VDDGKARQRTSELQGHQRHGFRTRINGLFNGA
jgi:hypothetical protein